MSTPGGEGVATFFMKWPNVNAFAADLERAIA